jgi:hypothetical protein
MYDVVLFTDAPLDSILRAHWSCERMDTIKAAYLTLYGEKLEKRIKDKKHGKFEDMLIALINGPALRA